MVFARGLKLPEKHEPELKNHFNALCTFRGQLTIRHFAQKKESVVTMGCSPDPLRPVNGRNGIIEVGLCCVNKNGVRVRVRHALFRVRPFLIALLLFVLFDLSLNIPAWKNQLDYMSNNPLPQKLQALKQDNPKALDVMVLGTSRVNNGFATPYFESASSLRLNTFNMGLPLANYLVLKQYLAFHIAHYGKPRIVVLEVADYLLNKRYYSYQTALYYRDLLYPQHTLAQVMSAPNLSWAYKQEILLSAVSNIYCYRRVLSPEALWTVLWSKISYKLNMLLGRQPDPLPALQRTQPHNTEALPYKEGQSYDGWYPRTGKTLQHAALSYLTDAQHRAKTFQSNYTEIDAKGLQEVIDLCQQHNIEVALLIMPNRPEYSTQFQRQTVYPHYVETVEALARRNNIALLDLSKERQLPGKDIYTDSIHLNTAGAITYTRLLKQQLLNNQNVSIKLRNTPVKTR